MFLINILTGEDKEYHDMFSKKAFFIRDPK